MNKSTKIIVGCYFVAVIVAIVLLTPGSHNSGDSGKAGEGHTAAVVEKAEPAHQPAVEKKAEKAHPAKAEQAAPAKKTAAAHEAKSNEKSDAEKSHGAEPVKKAAPVEEKKSETGHTADVEKKAEVKETHAAKPEAAHVEKKAEVKETHAAKPEAAHVEKKAETKETHAAEPEAAHVEKKAEEAHEAVKEESAEHQAVAEVKAEKADTSHAADVTEKAVKPADEHKAEPAHEAKAAPAKTKKEAEHKAAVNPFSKKPVPCEALTMLKLGNKRFVEGISLHPHLDSKRLKQAGSENQGNHAFATVITCSDSRVPVEAVFDAGVMDIFVIRVAGNVCDVDERGSIEYGLAHVNTPVLVVLGHTQCGAVTAVTQAVLGHGHALERNIPPLVDNIAPAVKRAMAANPDAQGAAIIPMAIEENVWVGIEELFMESPAVRRLFSEGFVKVVGAIYNVGTGEVAWLPESKTQDILKKVEASPDKATQEMAGGH